MLNQYLEVIGSIVNLTQKIISLTNGITARAAFGKRNSHQDVFISAMEKVLVLLGGFEIEDLYPSIQMPQMLSRPKNKLVKLQRETDMILQDIIDDHKRSNKETSKDNDLVDVLLKIQKENGHPQYPLTNDSIKSVIQDMFAAGSATSSGVVRYGRCLRC